MSCINCGHESMNHPDGQCYLCECVNFQMAEGTTHKGKDIKKIEWETTVKSWGNSAGITIPKSLLGRYVRISLTVLEG